MTILRTAGFVALLLALAAPSTAQFFRDVPEDFATIQEAVDAAGIEDTVRVGAGSFAGFSVIGRTEIEIVGKKGHRIVGDILVDDSILIELRNLRVEGSIAITDSNGIDVGRCRVFGGGIDVTNGGSVLVERNRVEEAFVGISVIGTEFQLRRNLILRPEDFGIQVSGDGTLKGNKIKGGGLGGSISVAGDGPVKVIRNQIVDAEGAGIVIVGERHQVKRNEVLGAGGDGIQCLEGGFNTFVGNLVKRVNDGFDIQAGCPGNELVGNTVKNVSSDGINIESDANQVTGNLIRRVEVVGIEVSGSDNSVIGNAVLDTGDDGIQCTVGSGNRFEANVVKRVGQDGFDIEDECFNNQIVNNTVKNAGSDGIDVGSSNEVTGNRIKGAADNGIELDGTGNIVAGNSIADVGGVKIREDVEGNIVSGG